MWRELKILHFLFFHTYLFDIETLKAIKIYRVFFAPTANYSWQAQLKKYYMAYFRTVFLVTATIFFLNSCGSSSPAPWLETESLHPDDVLSDEELHAIEFGIEFHEFGDFKRAREIYYEVLEDNPNSSLTLYQIAYAYNMEGGLDSCIEYAGRAVQIQSQGRGNALHMLGICLDMSNRAEEAILVFEEGLNEDPESYLMHYSLGITYARTGKVNETLHHLESAIELNPGHAGSHYLLATVHKDLNHSYAAWLGYNYFLLYEYGTLRAQDAIHQIQDILTPAVQEQEDGTSRVHLRIGNLLNSSDPKNRADLMFGISLSAITTEHLNNEEASVLEILNKQYERGFKLGEDFLDIDSAFGAVWNLYVPFFTDLNNKGHTAALVSIFFEESRLEGIEDWIDANPGKIQAFETWLMDYEDEYITN